MPSGKTVKQALPDKDTEMYSFFFNHYLLRQNFNIVPTLA